jgi:hypothetical protein
LRAASIPVVVVGPHARRWAASGLPIKSLLFATSLKGPVTDKENAKLTLKWTERVGGHMTLLHVLPERHKDKLAQEQVFRTRTQDLHALLPEDAFQALRGYRNPNRPRQSRDSCCGRSLRPDYAGSFAHASTWTTGA